MSRDSSDNAGPLPPWLRGVPLPPRPADANEPPAPFVPFAAAPAAPATTAEPLPEWLRDPGAEAGSAPTNSLPPWLQEDTPRPPAETGVTRDEPAMPAWLAGDEQGKPQETEALPDWLRDLAADQPASETAAVLDPSAETASVPPPAATNEDDVPDWLRGIAEPGTAVEPAAEQLPDWLREETAATSEPSAPIPVAPEPAPAAPEPASSDAAIPSWLSVLDTAPTTPNDAAGSVPEWLREAEHEPEPDATRDAAPPDADITPFSLADLGMDAPEPPTHPAAEPAELPTTTPDWLTNLGDVADDAAPAWLAGGTTSDARPEPQASDEPTIPAWLAADATAEPQPTPRAGEEADIPSWLRDIEDESPGVTTDAAGHASEPVADGDIPAWLRAATPVDAPSSPPAEPQPAAQLQPNDEGQALPDWLQPAQPEPQADDLRDWLRPAANTTAEPPVAVEGAVIPTADDALPDWLRPSEPTVQESESPASDGLPPWLHDEAGQPLPSATPPGEAGLPSWLRGASSDTPPADTSPAAVPELQTDAPSPGTLGWFDEPSDDADSEILGGAELPAWLKAETEPKQEAVTVDTRSVDWLTRLGVQDDEVVATAAPVARLAPPRLPARTAAHIEAAALLRQLAAAPYPDAEAVGPAAEPSIWRRLGLERAVYLLLLLALLGGLLLPALTVPLQGAPEAPGAAVVAERIDALTEQDVVLVGYEWDARRISELRPLEQAVIDHLIARNVKLVLVSTDPQGTLLLFDLRDKLTAAQYRQNGEGYLLLGYKPGGELALRTMAQDFQSTLRSDFIGNDASVSALATGLDTGTPLTSVRDFAMTIVLADEAADVQAWMEQIRPVTDAEGGTAGRPMLFLLPSEAAPIVQPYMAQPDVLSLAGYQGALAYLSQRGVATDSVVQAAAELRFATLAFVALLLVGGLVAVLSRAAARGRTKR